MSLEITDIANAVSENNAAMAEFAGETRNRLSEVERAVNVTRATNTRKKRGPLLITKDGKEIRCLTREDRFSDLASTDLPDGIKASELDFGRMLKGMVSNDWSRAKAEQKAMSTGVNSGGGFLVPDVLSGMVIDLARNATCVLEAGAVIVPMDSSTLTFAKVITDPTLAWKGENNAGTETAVVFGAGMLSANTLMGYVKASVELIEDAPNAGDLIQSTLAKALGLEMDRAFLYGTGSSSQPTGIKNRISGGVQEVTAATNGDTISNYDKLLNLKYLLQTTNTDVTNMALIMAPRSAYNFSKLKTGISSDQTTLVPPPDVVAMRKLVTNQVPINLTQGNSSVSTDIFSGDFSQAFVGLRKNITLEVSRTAADSSTSAFKNLQVFIRAYMRTDILLAHYDAFAIATGIVA